MTGATSRPFVPWVLAILLGLAFYPRLSASLESLARRLSQAFSSFAGPDSVLLSTRSIAIAMAVVSVLAVGLVIMLLKSRYLRAYGVLALAVSALAAWAAATSLADGASAENIAGLAGAALAATDGYGSLVRSPKKQAVDDGRA